MLEIYRDSYERLDASAAATIWRGVDKSALQRSFGSLSHQNLTFDYCDIALSDVAATANCRGLLRYVPRVGSPTVRVQSLTWTINLVRSNDQWLIERVQAR